MHELSRCTAKRHKQGMTGLDNIIITRFSMQRLAVGFADDMYFPVVLEYEYGRRA